MKINKEQFDNFKRAINTFTPFEMVLLSNIKITAMRMELKGCTDEEIGEAIRPKCELVNKFIEARKAGS